MNDHGGAPAAPTQAEAPLLDAHVAKRCAVRADLDHAIGTGTEDHRVGPTESAVARMEAGQAFEREMLDLIIASGDQIGVDVVEIAAGEGLSRQAATVAAMGTDATVIIGPWLPDDVAGRRVGRPDLLIRDAGGAWYPADVKHHLMTEAAGPRSFVRRSELDALAPGDATAIAESRLRPKRASDALQLAHYWRMMLAAGLADPAGPALGAIISTEQAAWWVDLDDTIWRSSSGAPPASALDAYDTAFGFRVAVVDRRLAINRGEATESLVSAIAISECKGCPWQRVCSVALADADHVSLLPGVQTKHVHAFAEQGVTTRSSVAELEPDAVALPGTAPKAVAKMIDHARAIVVGQPLLARGVRTIGVPRGDVEVDVDMENVDAGVYLWGTFTTVRSDQHDIAEGYQAFGSWDPVAADTAADVLAAFWAWLTDLRTTCADAGQTFRAYCYTNAEATKMRATLAANPDRTDLPSLADLEAFLASDEWVDLYAAIKGSLVTGGSMGLKAIAALAGFSWADEDPGGEQSMLWFRLASEDPDPVIRATNRARVLQYNEDDVRATLAVRDWLEVTDLASAADWPP